MDTNSSYISMINLFLSQLVAVLGADVVYAKVGRVSGIEVDRENMVVSVDGDVQSVFSNLLNQFSELSDLLVKRTLHSLIDSQNAASQITTTQVMQQAHHTPDAPQAAAPTQLNSEVVQMLQQSLSQMN